MSDLVLPDRAAAVAGALAEAAASHDVVLTSGGASRGDEDHVVRAVARQGRLHFWQIAVKPGRPLAFGQLGGCLFIGLPGNPVAAVICFLRFARPVLIALGGGRWPEPRAFLVPAGRHAEEAGSARVPARAAGARAGGGSGPRRSRARARASTSLVEADGLVELAEDSVGVEPGELVEFVRSASSASSPEGNHSPVGALSRSGE